MSDNDYTINFVDITKTPLGVPPNTVSNVLDVDLVGMGISQWGEKILENIVHVLENFSCNEDSHTIQTISTNSFTLLGDKRLGFILGNTFYIWESDNNDGTYIVDAITYDLIADETTIAISGTFITTAGNMGNAGEAGVPDKTIPLSPQKPIQGQLWYNQTRAQINVFDGTWHSVGGITFSATQPVSAADGDFWWDVSIPDRNLQIFVSGVWEFVVADFLLRDGTNPMAGDVDMVNTYTVTNLINPVALSDAMNLQYANNNYLNISGDTMTGPLNMNGTQKVIAMTDPTSPQDAMTLNYSDTNYLNLNGTVAMTGSLNLNNNTITNVAAPISPTDAVNKDYVDAIIIDPWPIGAVYISITAVNPNAYFGGTWEQIAQGEMLVGQDPSNLLFNVPEFSGGDADAVTVIHTHGMASNGNHNHIGGQPHDYDGAQYGYVTGAAMLQSHSNQWAVYRHPYTSTTGTHAHSINSVGVNGENLNLPPYFVTYMWKRTA